MNVRATLVNVVSDFADILALQQSEVATRYDYVFSDKPTAADFHVVVGQLGAQSIPPGSRAQLFVALEPPEIYRYDLAVMRRYTRTVGPGFRYFRNLPRHFVAVGLYPWRVGYDSESTESPEDFSLPNPVAVDAPPLVSALISGKNNTSKQRARRAAAGYLSRRFLAFRLAGRETQLVHDKADLHRLGKFHLAVENARHPFYNTEKLIDGILMKNIIFYDGDLRFLKLFDGRAIHPVDVNRKRATLRRILRATGARHSVQEEQEALEINRNLVLARHNFFANVEEVILQIEDCDSSAEFVEYPAHFSGGPATALDSCPFLLYFRNVVRRVLKAGKAKLSLGLVRAVRKSRRFALARGRNTDARFQQ